MEVLHSRNSLKKRVRRILEDRKRIGFVPTMGYLHEGHLSLVRRAKKESDIVVASIFVNPLQFGPKEDFKRYPRDIRRDTALLREAGVDILFNPTVDDLYPDDFQTKVLVSEVSQGLCGRTRPHHFGGVATVVLKLIQLVRPQLMYLGQKDFQQVRVIEQMVRDMDLDVKIVRCPTLREKDGLAMSSRNVYLSPDERQEAPKLFRALSQVSAEVRGGERRPGRLVKLLKRRLNEAKGGKIDYAEIVDARSLKPVVELKELPRGMVVLAAVAVYFSKARLIDNILIKV